MIKIEELWKETPQRIYLDMIVQEERDVKDKFDALDVERMHSKEDSYKVYETFKVRRVEKDDVKIRKIFHIIVQRIPRSIEKSQLYYEIGNKTAEQKNKWRVGKKDIRKCYRR